MGRLGRPLPETLVSAMIKSLLYAKPARKPLSFMQGMSSLFSLNSYFV